MVQHALHTLATDVALGGAVDRIAERHVVSGHGFGHGARGAAHAKEPPRHFLARAGLGKGAVTGFVEIDLEGLLMSTEALALFSPTRRGGRRDDRDAGPLAGMIFDRVRARDAVQWLAPIADDQFIGS